MAFWLRMENRQEELKPVPLIAQGDSNNATFSPDGNRVAFDYASCHDNKCGIYVKQVGGGPPVRLTDGESDFAPSWSPDDRSIAFLRGEGKDAAVMLIPAIGGRARAVARMDVVSWLYNHFLDAGLTLADSLGEGVRARDVRNLARFR